MALYARQSSKVRVKICLSKLPSVVLALPAVFAVALPRPVVSSSHLINCAIVKKILYNWAVKKRYRDDDTTETWQKSILTISMIIGNEPIGDILSDKN